MQLVKVNNKYRIEGLTDIQVLRIYKALQSVNTNNLLELNIMVDCLKMDIKKLNKEGWYNVFQNIKRIAPVKNFQRGIYYFAPI